MTFKFFLGGYGRDNYELKLDGPVLRCSAYEYMPSDTEEVIKVEGNKEWEDLTDFLKGCDWKKSYTDPFTCDGTQWELKVNGKGIKINSCGSNLYPAQFDEFLVLLNRVVFVCNYFIVIN